MIRTSSVACVPWCATFLVVILTVFSHPCGGQGVGMTMPVNPPAEACKLNINAAFGRFGVPQPPSLLLPVQNYNMTPSWALDTTSASVVSGSCDTSWKACPSSGSITESDGRLNPSLRGYASSQDARYLLVSAVWAQLGVAIAGNPTLASCADTSSDCATALAQLAVTGRHAFNSFSSWDPPSILQPNTSGPQADELANLVQSGYTATAPQLLPANFVKSIPPISSAAAQVSTAQVQAAADTVVQQAYTALWAIRANDPAWRQYRVGAGWIAVSGEDDTPHRPVNVTTAPFSQFDIPVPVTVNGQSFSLTTRYMLAAVGTALDSNTSCSACGQSPPAVAAPPIPTSIPLRPPVCGMIPVAPGKVIFVPCSRLELPSQSLPPQLGSIDNPPAYIIYIHGGGSRLEEADDLAIQLIEQAHLLRNGPPGSGALLNRTLVVISVDLPNSAYADQSLIPTGGGAPVPLDASSSLFENAPNTFPAPGTILSLPVLNFEINFINSFIRTLGQNKIIDPSAIVAVMGGSLGGNASLILRMNPMQAPFTLNSPLSIPPTAATVAWSPTTVLDVGDPVRILTVRGNMCCLVGGPGPTWQTEASSATSSTRQNYF